MKKVDDLMINYYGVSVLQMMENDAKALARLAKEILKEKKKVIVFAGKGGNGGGALAAARHLAASGLKVDVVLAAPLLKSSQEVNHHIKSLKKMKVKSIPLHTVTARKLNSYNLIIDGLLGYSLKGVPRQPYKHLIKLINTSKTKVLSNDVPSGLDSNRGKISDTIIKADYTLTIAAPKLGLKDKKAKPYIGKLYLADITVPDAAYKKARSKFRSSKYFKDDFLIPLHHS